MIFAHDMMLLMCMELYMFMQMLLNMYMILYVYMLMYMHCFITDTAYDATWPLMVAYFFCQLDGRFNVDVCVYVNNAAKI